MSNKRVRVLALLLIVLAVGSVLMAACTRPGTVATNTASNASSGGGGGEPSVHMSDQNFLQASVDVPKGQKLKLIDDSAALHVLQNGMWDNGAQKVVTESGAPKLDNLQIAGNSTVEIGPFNTAGTFHIFCNIHPGMNLVVNVK